MPIRILATGIAVVLYLNVSATAEMFKIENPASNIYNPASRMDNPKPLSPPTQPVPQPTVTKEVTTTAPTEQLKEQPHPQPQQFIPHKNYSFKTAGAYITAAKKAFIRDDYREFLSITEDALIRINAGTLKASKKLKQKLNKFRVIGYELLKKNDK